MPRESLREVYINRRMAVLLGLGFSSGLPLKLTQGTMQAWLDQAHVSIEKIGLFALVTLPYSLKFIWSPVLDRFMPPGLAALGRRRGWIVVTQVLLVAAIAAMGMVSPARSVLAFGVAALVVAFLSASQDIVIDAYRTDVLPREELGAGAAMHVNGYRLAMLVSGGGAMILADHVSWGAVYALMALLMVPGLIATALAPRTEASSAVAKDRPRTFNAAVVEPLSDFFGRLGWRAWLVLVFIFLFKAPEVMAGWQTVPFLQASGFSKSQIGEVQQAMGIAITILGTLAGGAVVARFGVVRSLWVVGLLGAASNASFMVLAAVGNRGGEMFTLHLAQHTWVVTQGFSLLVGVVAVESFCYGLVTAGFVAFLMSLCNRRYSATQYALLTSLMGLAGTVFPLPTGWVIAHVGWAWFFALTIVAGAPGLVALCWVREAEA